MAIWLAGYTRHIYPGLTGYSFDYYDKPKLCWHTTEGGSVGGALGAYAPYPPHLIVDPRTGEKLQHISLDLAAYSAMDNNDEQHIIQVEVVGYANNSHLWPDSVLRWLAENVVKPIRAAVGVPDNYLRFYGEGEGVILASPNSPIRLSPSALRNFTGHLGHQHLSYPDSHWDPGRLPIGKILGFAGASTGEDDMFSDADRGALRDMWQIVSSGEKRDGQLNKDLAFIRESLLAPVESSVKMLNDLHATIVSGSKRDGRLTIDLGYIVEQVQKARDDLQASLKALHPGTPAPSPTQTSEPVTKP